MIDRRRLLDQMQKLDFEMRLRHYPSVIEADEERTEICPPDAEEFFLAEQCPSDATFR